jgi:hypothetical protein
MQIRFMLTRKSEIAPFGSVFFSLKIIDFALINWNKPHSSLFLDIKSIFEQSKMYFFFHHGSLCRPAGGWPAGGWPAGGWPPEGRIVMTP